MHLSIVNRIVLFIAVCIFVLPIAQAAETVDPTVAKDKSKAALQVLAKTLKPDIDQKEAGNFIELAKASYQSGRLKDALAQLDKA